MRIAIVGSGISGTGAAWLLSHMHSVDIYEAEPRLGGHANTVDITAGGVTFPVDTGFMVFNEMTYPNLIRFFERLGVGSNRTDMSFSVRIEQEDIEWNGNDLNTVFSQRKNLVDLRFLSMLAGVFKLSSSADRLLADPAIAEMTLGDLLARERYSKPFSDWYLLPMGGAIWSTPPGKMLDYPAETFLHFMNNHGLLHVLGKPDWLSVKDGSRGYVRKALENLAGEAHAAEAVERVERIAGRVRIHTARRAETYDAVILAAHAPDSLALLGDGATDAEKDILGSIPYQPSDIALHSDASFMPREKRTWASWNWHAESGESDRDGLALTYWINSLQGLPAQAPPVFETLNPQHPVLHGEQLARLEFEHPLFTKAAIVAQSGLGSIQGIGGVWYTGAWQRYGFHEDGLLSAVRVSEAVGAVLPWGNELDESRTRVREAASKGSANALGRLAPQSNQTD